MHHTSSVNFLLIDFGFHWCQLKENEFCAIISTFCPSRAPPSPSSSSCSLSPLSLCVCVCLSFPFHCALLLYNKKSSLKQHKCTCPFSVSVILSESNNLILYCWLSLFTALKLSLLVKILLPFIVFMLPFYFNVHLWIYLFLL